DAARTIRNQALIAQTLNFLGDNAIYRGDVRAAAGAFERALKEASQTADQHLLLLSKANAARVVLLAQRDSRRSSPSAASRRITDASSDARVKGILESLGDVQRQAERLGFKYLAVQCSIEVAEASLYAGDAARGQAELERASAQSEKMGLRPLR